MTKTSPFVFVEFLMLLKQSDLCKTR